METKKQIKAQLRNQISKEMQVILQVYENKAKCQVLDFSDFVIF